MTFVASATQQDRQDFVGTEALNAAPLFVNAGPNILHGETTGLFDVRRWPYLQLRMFNVTAARTMWVSVQWFDDTALTTIVGGVNFTTLSSARITDSVPNLGPYCSVTVFWDDNATHQGSGVIMGRMSPGISGVGEAVGGSDTQVLISDPFAVLGAAVQRQTLASWVQRGKALFASRADIGAGGAAGVGVYAELQELDVAGAFTRTIAGHFHFSTATTYIESQIAVGTHQLRLAITNSTAAGIGCLGTVTMMPLL